MTQGLYKPLVMFFGLCNSSATFQSIMNHIFRQEIKDGWLEVYLDDILIHSHMLMEHIKCMKLVLQQLKDNDLYLKPEKCTFDATRVDYLGFTIQKNKIRMDKTKVHGLSEWPKLQIVKHVQQFLGFGNYYQKFISHYANIARPLHTLTGKDVPSE
jgi:hypothetical protein